MACSGSSCNNRFALDRSRYCSRFVLCVASHNLGVTVAIKAPFDVNKFRRDIKRATKVESERAVSSFNSTDLKEIGESAIAEMKTLVSQGISPIKGYGRFPGYKWVSAANALVKSKKATRKQARNLTKNKYPYSVMRKFPNKQVRPVNLKLSGDFLSALKARPQSGAKKTVKIGIFDESQAVKEQGHREGANGQPKRPIIPIGNEEFSPSIYRRIVDTVTGIVRRKFKT